MSYARNLARIARTGAPSVDSMQELRNLPIYDGLYPEVVIVTGHTTKGDGGGGVFNIITGKPPGTYTDDNGTTVVFAGGDGSVAAVRDFDGPIHTAWYGIGGVDDSVAVQAAVDAAAAADGALYLSSLPHKFSHVELRDGLTITSDGAQVRLLSTDAAFWNKDATPYAVSDVSISGIEFLRDENDNSGEIAIVLRTPATGRHKNISIKDCIFTRILAYYIWSCDGLTTRNCTFQDTMYSGKTATDYASSASAADEPVVTIDGNIQSNCMDTHLCTSLDVSNNNFKSVLSVGHFDQTAGGAFNNNIVYETAYSALFFRNQAGDTSGIAITGNVFRGIGKGPIVVDRFGTAAGFRGRAVTITGNTIDGYCVTDKGSHRAIHVANESRDIADYWGGVVISSNTIITNDKEWPNPMGNEKGSCIWCSGSFRSLVISNNTCQDTPSHGIYVSGRTLASTSADDSVLITGNVISNCGGSVRFSDPLTRGTLTVVNQKGLVQITNNVLNEVFLPSPTVPFLLLNYCYNFVVSGNHLEAITNKPEYAMQMTNSGRSIITHNVMNGYVEADPINYGGALRDPLIYSNAFSPDGASPYSAGYAFAGPDEQSTSPTPAQAKNNVSGYLKSEEIGGVTIMRIWDGVRTVWTPQQPTIAGSTADRPTGVSDGFMYYDTTIMKPIWWRNIAWRDSTGATA